MTIWPAEYRQWARQAGLLVERPRRPAEGIATVQAQKAARAAPGTLEIANPPAGSTYMIDPTLRPEFQTLALRATAGSPGDVEWRVNGQSVGTSSSESAVHWPLKVGVHRIAVRDTAGRTAQTTIIVR
jgi:membrane carboxypeptidase/penicillin-binding protein PbpC